MGAKETTEFNAAEERYEQASRELSAAELGERGTSWQSDFRAAHGKSNGNSDWDPQPFKPLTRSQSVEDWARRKWSTERDREYEKLTLGQICRAMALGPQSDLERRALAEGVDASGGYTVPTILSGNIIDRLRESAKVFQAGAQTLMLEQTGWKHDFATIATDPSVTWHAENTAENSTDIVFGRVRFTPKTAMVLTQASRELVEDSVNLDQAIRQSFVGALASAIDQAVLTSTGGNAPTGILSTTTISTVIAGSTTVGHLLTHYGPLVTAYTQTITNNAPATAAIMATREYGRAAAAFCWRSCSMLGILIFLLCCWLLCQPGVNCFGAPT